MRTITLFLIASTCAFAQASASITFPGDIGSTLTVSQQAFPVLIAEIEITPASGTSPTTLSAALTTAATTISLTNATGVLPGMGIALGTCPGTGCVVALIKAAGCTGNICPVAQGSLGTTPTAFPLGTAVTILQYGSGEALICAQGATKLQALAAAGGATYNAPSNSTLASATIAAANADIATQVATIGSVIAAAATCVPNQ